MAGARAHVLATGLVTPVGLGSGQTTMAIRAGVPGFEAAQVRDRDLEPFVMALVPEEALPDLDKSLRDAEPRLTGRQQRMLRLAAPAVEEALQAVDDPESVPLLLACPEPLERQPDPAGGDFLSHLACQSGVAFDLGRSQVVRGAGGLLALRAGLQAIEAGHTPRVLVGGVDTHLDPYLLATLDREARIQSGRVMDGFIPGETAAFVLLGTPGAGGEPLAGLLGVGTGQEPGHRGSELPYTGDGLAGALSGAVSGVLNGSKLQTVFAGLSGDNLDAKEWGVAYLRNQESIAEDHQLEHPADCVGHTAAASGPLMIALAALGLGTGDVDGPCLVWCGSDGPERAAAVLDGLR